MAELARDADAARAGRGRRRAGTGRGRVADHAGVLTDALGLLLLLPRTRRLVAARVRRAIDQRIAAGQLQVMSSGLDSVWSESARRSPRADVVETHGEDIDTMPLRRRGFRRLAMSPARRARAAGNARYLSALGAPGLRATPGTSPHRAQNSNARPETRTGALRVYAGLDQPVPASTAPPVPPVPLPPVPPVLLPPVPPVLLRPYHRCCCRPYRRCRRPCRPGRSRCP